MTQGGAQRLRDLERTIFNIRATGQGDLETTGGIALHVAGPFRGHETPGPVPHLRGPGDLQNEDMSKQS